MPVKALPALLVLLVAVGAAPALGQSGLVLPSSADDYRKLAKPVVPPGPCTTCGVVTDVRSEQIEVGKMAPTATPGGAVLQPSPIVGTGSTVQDARKSTKQTIWKVTVRYDNGSYAAFDQDDEPTIRKGDKVRVAEGKVELR
jgi:hypothetical protein